MKRKSIPAIMTVAIFATCVSGWNWRNEGHAQDRQANGPAEVRAVEPAIPVMKRGEEGDAQARGETNWPKVVRIYKERMKRAANDAEKEEVQQELRKLVNDAFEADLEERQKDIEEVKARVAALEALLEKRRQEKANIIELHIKTLQNEAEGLGFFTEPLGDAKSREGLNLFSARRRSIPREFPADRFGNSGTIDPQPANPPRN